MSTNNQDYHVVVTRVLDAPCELVYKAFTEPEQVEKWWGPAGFGTRVERLDFRPGGKWRYVMLGPEGEEYPSDGTFREIVPNKRIVTTDDFAEDFPFEDFPELPHGIVIHIIFEDMGRQTRLTIRMEHPTAEDMQKHLAMGVVDGWNSSLDCLEEHLAKEAQQA
jgi:uncharacterized protein YndB with AHSA1/START domain